MGKHGLPEDPGLLCLKMRWFIGDPIEIAIRVASDYCRNMSEKGGGRTLRSDSQSHREEMTLEESCITSFTKCPVMEAYMTLLFIHIIVIYTHRSPIL